MKLQSLNNLCTRVSVALVGLFAAAHCLGADQREEAQGLAAPTNSSPPIQLRNSTVVDGGGVFLHQVLDGPSALPHLRLCDAPAFGKSVVLKRADVIALCDTVRSELCVTNWAGSEAVRISRKSRILGQRELVELLTASLQQQHVKDTGQLELRLARAWVPVSVPDESFKLSVSDVPTSGIGANFLVRLELETSSGERIGSWQTALQAKIWREIWVARSVIKRGESVRGADLVLERRDMLVCREAVADLSSDNGSLEFSEPLAAGAPVLARAVKPRAIVRRGQSVAAVVQDGPLLISLKVEALEDGAAGQFIRVRNPNSRRDLHAKIIDEQNVQVSL